MGIYEFMNQYFSTVIYEGKKQMLSLIVSSLSFTSSTVKTYPGVSAPVGFFDPLKLSTGISEGRFKFYREAELKHGRVAMLAALGFPVAEQFHPLFGGDIDVPSYVAFQQTPLQGFWPTVLFVIGLIEWRGIGNFNPPFSKGEPWTLKDGYEPGNMKFDPLKLKPKNKEELTLMQTKELNNGRVAMSAIALMVLQEVVTNTKLF